MFYNFLFLLFLSILRAANSQLNASEILRTRKLGCYDLVNVRVGNVFAHGQKKEVLKGLFGDVPVVIARPYDGAFWHDNVKGYTRAELESRYSAYFAAERVLFAKFNPDFVPRFFGGCWSTFGTTVHIGEYLRGYMDVACDAHVDWKQRVRLAAETVRMLRHFDDFPPDHNKQQLRLAAVYGDMFAKQFAVDSQYRVKVVDLQSFFPYSVESGGYGRKFHCDTDQQCRDKYWYATGYPNVMRGLRRLLPDDFGCDKTEGLCRGLNTKTLLMAACHLMIEPMFLVAENVPKAVRSRVETALRRCMDVERAKRASVTETIAAFEALLPTDETLPRLPLVNENIAQYQQMKEKFENARHEREKELMAARTAAKQPHKAKLDEIDNLFC